MTLAEAWRGALADLAPGRTAKLPSTCCGRRVARFLDDRGGRLAASVSGGCPFFAHGA